MYSFYPDSLLIIYLSKTTNQVTEIIDIYANKRIRHDTRGKQIVAETLDQNSLKGNFQVRTFNVKNKRFVISLDKVGAFIDEFPESNEFFSYSINKDTVDLTILEIPDFLLNNPMAIPNFNYPEIDIQLINSLVSLNELNNHLTRKVKGYNVPIEQFRADMQDEKNRRNLHYSLSTRQNLYLPYKVFEELLMFDMQEISNADPSFDKLIFALYEQSGIGYEPTEEDIKEIKSEYKDDYRRFLTDFYKQAGIDYVLTENDFVEIKNKFSLGEAGKINYLNFSKRIKQVYPEYLNMNDLVLAESFVKKYPIYMGRITFSPSLSTSSAENEKTIFSENVETKNTLFYMDRVKIGQTEIGLPVPSEFVRIDGSHLEQLKIAELSVPETNSLLAYYLGENDFADLVATGSYKRDKYIMIQIFDELKYQNVKKITFRKYLKKFRNDYKFEFQESFNERTIEAVNSIPESIIGDFKLNKMDAYPLGIYHDSNSAVSIGLLSKMDFSSDGVSNQDILVASISTIINIKGKVLFLYLYKTYNHNSDLDWLKKANESWINEIEKKQSPTNFFTEFDFMQFREVIMAILFLGFLWGGYIATKKIVKRTKANRANPPSPGLDENLEDENLVEPSNSISTGQENPEEFIDFDELLMSTDEDTSISASNKSQETQDDDEDDEVKSESSEENGYYIAEIDKQWKVARTGLIIFGVLHFILEIMAESKLPILPVLINYYISAYYIKQQIKKNRLRSHPYMIAFSTSIVVFLVRVLFGLFLYLLGV